MNKCIIPTSHTWELYYISKKEADFCRPYKRDKPFCTIGGF